MSYHFSDHNSVSITYLPTTIKCLTLRNDFNQPINHLPIGLTHLIAYCSAFNQPINCLPNTITHLDLRCNFNQPINSLPDSIINLSLGIRFNQSIDYLPKSLSCLTLNCNYYNESINKLLDILPKNIIVKTDIDE